MELPRTRWSDQERKKLAVKIGGGGGIGTVVLLGGALATAALASVFIVGKKGRSSGKDGSPRRRRHQSQDSPPEINKQKEEDEENKGEEIISLDQPSHLHKHPSGGETKEVEEDNGSGLLVSTQSLKLDEKPRVEITGGTQGDVDGGQASEQILCKQLEKDAISDGFVVVEDEKLPFEHQTMIEDEVETPLTRQDVSNEILQESQNTDKVDVEGEPSDDGEEVVLPVFESRLVEEKNVNGDEKEGSLVTETVEMIQRDEADEGNHDDEVKYVEIKEQEKCDQTDEGIVPGEGEEQGWTDEGNQSNTHSNLQIGMPEKKIDSGNKEDDAGMGNPALEDGQFGVPILEQEVICREVTKEYGADVEEISESLEVNGDETSIVAGNLEVMEDNCQPKDDEDDSRENNGKEVEEELISPEDIAREKELHENKISIQSAQPQDPEDDADSNIAEEVEEEVISPENGFERNDVKELETLCEITEIGFAKVEDDVILETSEDDEKGEANLSDEVEESSVGTGDSSTESNSEAIWPAESLQETSVEPQMKLMDREVGGKIQEDKTVKESAENSQDSSFEPYQVKAEEKGSLKISANLSVDADNSRFPYKNGNSDKTLVKRYAVNSTSWRMLIGVLAVVSTLSGSWFFGLSFVKLCLIAFLTMVLSKIYGY